MPEERTKRDALNRMIYLTNLVLESPRRRHQVGTISRCCLEVSSQEAATLVSVDGRRFGNGLRCSGLPYIRHHFIGVCLHLKLCASSPVC